MTECTHPRLHYGSGGYYLICGECFVMWSATRTDGQHDARQRTLPTGEYVEKSLYDQATRERDEALAEFATQNGVILSALKSREKAERERDEARRERDEAREVQAHDLARQSVVIAFLRKRRGQLVIERDEARRERDEARRERDEARRERDEARAALEKWDQVRSGVADLNGYTKDWPSHGNAPLAVMAAYLNAHAARRLARVKALKDREP